MASVSRDKFSSSVDNGDLLCLRGQGRTLTERQRKVQYHAALASTVAAWEAYLESVVREFLAMVTDPLDIRYSNLQQLHSAKVEGEIRRFNTPNSKNSRELIATTTGYDPINDWSWRARNMGGVQLRGQLDEIVQVRHSFAHGYQMPSFSWNTSSTGKVRLTADGTRMAAALFSELVRITDRGLNGHAKAAFRVVHGWY